jgi:hypothetical protein
MHTARALKCTESRHCIHYSSHPFPGIRENFHGTQQLPYFVPSGNCVAGISPVFERVFVTFHTAATLAPSKGLGCNLDIVARLPPYVRARSARVAPSVKRSIASCR